MRDVILELVDAVDGLDAQHEALIAHQFVQLRLNKALEPRLVKHFLAQGDQCDCRLLTNREDRVSQHRYNGWLNLLLHRVTVEVLAQLGEKVDRSVPDAPRFVLSEVHQCRDQFLIQRSHW